MLEESLSTTRLAADACDFVHGDRQLGNEFRANWTKTMAEETVRCNRFPPNVWVIFAKDGEGVRETFETKLLPCLC